MQMVQAFAASSSTITSAAASSLSSSGASPATASVGAGGSVVSSLANFALAGMNQQATQDEAWSANLQARGAYVQSAEKANSIKNAMVQTSSALTSAAAAGGIDVASGSVQAARRTIQTQGDNALEVDRDSADETAQLLRTRAAYLDKSAQVQGVTGVINFANSIANSVAQAAAAG